MPASPFAASDRAAPSASHASRTIPSLDGLRALSIVLVVFDHLVARGALPLRPASILATFFSPGAFGVRVFFVISGCLITTLLLREVERTGRVNLGRFYFRRTLRIFPPYYAYLGVLWLLAAWGVVTPHPGDFVRAFTYTVNSLGGYPPGSPNSFYVGHAWSLSIEEQFYLLWPAILLLVGAARAWRLAVAVVLLGPLVKAGLHVLSTRADYGNIGMSFLGVADCLAVGCAFAGLRPALHGTLWYRRALGHPRIWLLVPLAVLAFTGAGRWGLVAATTQPICLVSLAVLVDRVVTYPCDRVGRALNAGPVVWIGRLSYSIYLWQALFTLPEQRDTIMPDLGVTSLPWNLACILACAVASYYLIEQPSLRARGWLECRWFGRRSDAPVAVLAHTPGL